MKWRWGAIAAFAILLACGAAWFYQRSPLRGLPYKDSFAAGKSEGWLRGPCATSRMSEARN